MELELKLFFWLFSGSSILAKSEEIHQTGAIHYAPETIHQAGAIRYAPETLHQARAIRDAPETINQAGAIRYDRYAPFKISQKAVAQSATEGQEIASEGGQNGEAGEIAVSAKILSKKVVDS